VVVIDLWPSQRDTSEVRQEFSVCFRAKMTGGELRTSPESRHVRWVPASQLDDLQMNPSMRLRVTHGIEDRETPYLG